MQFNPIIHHVRGKDEIERLIRQIGAEGRGPAILAPKGLHRIVQLRGVRSPAANILKQEMLSLGGDVAVATGVVNCSVDRSNVLLLGTLRQLRSLTARVSSESGFELSELAMQVGDALDNYQTELADFRCGRYTLPLSSHTHIMGVLNVTTDSFYRGNCYLDPDEAVAAGLRMIEEGADLIDIGGESTRPGAEPVRVEEELRRVLPVVERLAKEGAAPVSVDTYKAEVAKRVLDAGADMINDISGLSFDSDLAADVAQYRVSVIISHIQGVPKTMQDDPRYDDLLGEVTGTLRQRCDDAEDRGIPRDQIIVDPGIGFGKTAEQCLQLIKNLGALRSLGAPVLIGVSRKSFLGEVLGAPPEERLIGTLAAVALSIEQGAHIVRVHDVREVKQIVHVADSIHRGRITRSEASEKPREERRGEAVR